MGYIDYSDRELVKKAILLAHHVGNRDQPWDQLWMTVRGVFGVSSTQAKRICIDHGFNPESSEIKSIRGDDE